MTNVELNALLIVLKKNNVQFFKNGKMRIQFAEPTQKTTVIQALGEVIEEEKKDDDQD